jgi:thiamine biosynthesis lipoprotein
MDEHDDILRRAQAFRDLGLTPASQPLVIEGTESLGREGWRVTAVKPAMGTRVVFTALGRSRDRIEEAFGRAGEEIDRLVGVFNRYDPVTAVGVLNRDGRLPGPPPELVEVVGHALRLWRLSRGAFDVTVRPLVDLLGRRGPDGAFRTPSEIELREALARVGSRDLDVTRRAIGLRREGMGLTCDGIAKGYIVDRACRQLRRRGVRRFLVDAGGDIRAAGGKEGGAPWTVAVRDPRGGPDFPDLIEIRDGAVATSGSYEVYYDEQRLHHHIIDIRTGRSPQEAVSVSVRAPTAMAADALATAAFVLGPAEAASWIDGIGRCAALVIDRTGRLLRSRRWRSVPPETGPAAAAD